MILVLDSSPLITLARIAKLPLLQSLAQQTIIPSGVYQEIVNTGKDRPGALSVQTTTWLVQKNTDRCIRTRPIGATLREGRDGGHCVGKGTARKHRRT